MKSAGLVVDDALQEMKVWPFEAAPCCVDSKSPRAALTKDRRGERSGKRHPWRCRVGIGKKRVSESLPTCRNKDRRHQNRGTVDCSGMSLAGVALIGRAASGMEAT